MEQAKLMIIAALILTAIPLVYSAQDSCQSAQYFDYEYEKPAQTIAQGQEHWWKTSTEENGKITAYLTGPAGTDFDMFMYNSCPAQETKCYSNKAGSNEQCSFYTYSDQDHYIQVLAYSGTGNYKLETTYRKNEGTCRDNYCNTGETTTNCPEDCGKKHSYNQFPSEWNAQISETYKSELNFGKNYELPLLIKCSSPGQAYIALILENSNEQNSIEANSFDNNQKLTCGNPENDAKCENKALAKLYLTSADCNGEYKQKTVNFTIPNEGNEGQYYLVAEYWAGYEENGETKIDINDGGIISNSPTKLVTISKYKCSSNTQCKQNEYCSAGSCEKDVCPYEAQNYCENNNVYSCNSDGSTKSLIKNCQANQICQAATCINQTACGNNACENGENNQNCPNDCKTPCQNYCEAKTLYTNGTFKNSRCTYQTITCSNGCFEGTCLNPNDSPITLRLEYALQNTKVFKQSEDFVTISIYSTKEQTINLSIPSSLTLISGNYANGKANLTAGKNEIKLQLPKDTTTTYIVTANNAKAEFETTKAQLIIITDKKALEQRYTEKTDEIMQEAYNLAAKKQAVIYDLSQHKTELGPRPWNNYAQYNEKPTQPNNKDNTYAKKVSELISRKCVECKNVLIIGDDFVIPMFRQEYNQFTGWNIPATNNWVNKKTTTNYIYTDTPHIPKTARTVGDISTIFNHAVNNQHKDRLLQISVDEKIIYIVPDDYSDYESLKLLNDTIKKAYPKIKEKNYAVYKSSEVACNDWNKLEENTLILIGDRSNNNAIKCTPWFDVGKKPSDTFTASVTLERNVWGGNNYAIVLSGNTTQATLYLKDLIENPERHELAENTQTIYLNEFSMPPEYTTGKDYINGYALGQCENINEGDGQLGCHILSFGTYFVPYVGWAAVGRDVGNYCLVAEHDGTDWFGCATSATAIGVKLGLVGKTFNWLKPTTELKAYTKLQTIIRSHTPQHADNILNTLNINNKQKLKIFFQTNKQETALEQELANKLDELERTIRKNKEGYNAIAKLQENSGKNLLNGVKYQTEFEDIGRGATILEKAYNGIEKAPLEEKELAILSKNLGTATKDFSPTANNRATIFIKETIETDTSIPEGAKILDSITKIKGKEYVINILKDPNKIVRKIPKSSIPNTPTPDAQLDTYVIEAKTLRDGNDIINVHTSGFENNFEDAAKQLQYKDDLIVNPKRIIQLDASKRKFLPKNPNDFINQGGLEDIWKTNQPIDELWLKLKDQNNIEQLWVFNQENGRLKGVIIK